MRALTFLTTVAKTEKHLFLRNVQRGKRQQKHPRSGKERGNDGQRRDGDDRKGDEGKGIFWLLRKGIINNFFWGVGWGGGFVIYIGVNPHWESGTALLYWWALCFSSSLLISEESSQGGDSNPGQASKLTNELRQTSMSYHTPQWATPRPSELCHTPLIYATLQWATPHPNELRQTPMSYATP